MSVGSRIKQRRESLGMTQEELAQKVGYTNRTTITKIEKGVNDIIQSKLWEFANALRTTPGYLLGYDEPDSTTNDKFIDYRFKDGTSFTITADNERLMSNVKKWIQNVNEFDFDDNEMEELMNYAKFIMMKRK
ncbi:MAG: helix-turn-helix transcriptional regulator [Erysipelotrichaceae bacterium]|nr:helix-turn-helix transcriptional regulator [Erysipelotrichaceae bacterium]